MPPGQYSPIPHQVTKVDAIIVIFRPCLRQKSQGGWGSRSKIIGQMICMIYSHFHDLDISGQIYSWSVWAIDQRARRTPYNLHDLASIFAGLGLYCIDPARIGRRAPYHLHTHVFWVGSVLHRSSTTHHNGRLGSRWSTSWSIWSVCRTCEPSHNCTPTFFWKNLLEIRVGSFWERNYLQLEWDRFGEEVAWNESGIVLGEDITFNKSGIVLGNKLLAIRVGSFWE